MIRLLLQRIAIYIALGMLLSIMHVSMLDIEFWCVMAIAWALEQTVREETLMLVHNQLEKFIENSEQKDKDNG